MQKINIEIKPVIKIKGCTDRTCRDCKYWSDEYCHLFLKQLKEYKDKSYQIESTLEPGYFYNDFARCKECLEAEKCQN